MEFVAGPYEVKDLGDKKPFGRYQFQIVRREARVMECLYAETNDEIAADKIAAALNAAERK